MLRRVALVRTDVQEELSASSISVTRIGEVSLINNIMRRSVVKWYSDLCFAYPQMQFLFNFVPSESLVYNSTYTRL
jgi:hypothetical protein